MRHVVLVCALVTFILGFSCFPAVAAAQVGASGGGGGVRPATGAPAIMLPPAVPEAPAAGSGAISGVVVDAATKSPLADSTVYLSTEGRGTVGSQSRQITDQKGRFAFTNLPA